MEAVTISSGHASPLKAQVLERDNTLSQELTQNFAQDQHSHASAAEWKKVLERVVPACLVLRVTQTRALDTEAAGSAYATGFIVDAKRGIILTNRHVVTPGPITAEATFLNREELPVKPLYYDPIHDFGFMRFDTSQLQFMNAASVPLAPEAASVGLEIRVIGNDSGEKVSILAGTIARLDRDAPHYTSKGYNDFNTFYLQAASGTKGGSSGSPVVDSLGRAVALNAGGKNKAASAYYLPLHRVVRALEILQAHLDAEGLATWAAARIPRGDLHATFLYKGFDEVRRLGLSRATEAAVRAAAGPHSNLDEAHGLNTGMLVVESVVPGGPAAGRLEPGDVLVRAAGQIVTHFLPLEDLLDNAVGQGIDIQVERGGRLVSCRLTVADLHAVSPSHLLDFAGAAVHALSYQQARNNGVPVGSVYVAEPGYLLNRAQVPKHAIIKSLNNTPTPNLAAFAAALAALPDGARAPLRYYTFAERHVTKSGILPVDRRWYGPPVHWQRDDARGEWIDSLDNPNPAAPVPAAVTLAAATANQEGGEVVEDEEEAEGAEEMDEQVKFEAAMRRCLCIVDVDIPLVALADGVHSRSFTGNGVVLHHSPELGIVLVDRNTVAIGPGDIMLSFGAYPTELPATVRFLHPLHNFALLSYNPAGLPPHAFKAVCAAELMAEPAVRRGEEVWLVGLTKGLATMQRRSTVTSATFAVNIEVPEVPRFRAVHEEVIKLDHDFGSTFSGVVTDAAGRVRALWGSYSEQADKDEREWCAGLPASVVRPWVAALLRGLTALRPTPGPPPVPVLDCELQGLALSKAALYGLPQPWVHRLAKLDPLRRQVLRVRSVVAGGAAAALLSAGDLLLALDGQPVTSFSDIDRIIAGFHPAPAHDAATAKRPLPIDPATPTAPAAKKICTDDGTAAPAGTKGDASVAEGDVTIPVTVCRGGKVEVLGVQLSQEDGLGTDCLVHWCGAQLQAPHRGVRELGYLPDAGHGVYISRWHHGSPAHRYGLYALHWITHLNDTPTPTLDAFMEAARLLQDHTYVRVHIIHMETTKPKVLSVKMDLRYWPTWCLKRDPATAEWRREIIADLTSPSKM